MRNEKKTRKKPDTTHDKSGKEKWEKEMEFFESEMKKAGVIPLAKKRKTKHPARVSSPIRLFEDTSKEDLSQLDKPQGKYAGKTARGKPPIRKKIKITRDFEPDETLDLHGETQESALIKLRSVLSRSVALKLRHVLVITGKGLNSTVEGGVLRKRVLEWLETKPELNIRDFQFAPSFLGGEGAILILLK
ncbi:MAG: Smr/MutS family protein [Deltaproteobacteria bacterium]|nr:Smr/MutS family protein [Deltaproteobacteria bacterium]